MPSWYVHIQAAAQTMETMRDSLPPGSPLTQAEANDLFTAAAVLLAEPRGHLRAWR